MKRFLIIVLLGLYSLVTFSQETVNSEFYADHLELETVLKNIETTFNVKFSYNSELVNGVFISLDNKKRTLDEVLFDISLVTNFQFNKIDDKYIYITKSTAQSLNEVLITSYLTNGISKKQDASFNLKPKKMGVLAGLTEVDILESIQQLPGVISINETATNFSVRGGFSDQNHVIWDGITIYHGGHLFGMVSVFNPNIAQNISFYNKGTNVKYGERISSVIDITTPNNISNTTSFEAGINGINADAYIDVPIFKDKVSIQGSIRRSYEDIYETKTFKQYEEKAFQHTQIDEEFFYFKDYNFKINYQVNNKNFLYLSLIHIDNDLENDFSEIDSNKSYNDVLDSENDGYSLFWNRQWKENIWQETQVVSSKYRFDYHFTTLENEEFISKFSKYNTISDFGVSTTLNIKTKANNLFVVGYQNSIKHVDFLFENIEDITYVLDSDNSEIYTHSLYSSFTYDIFKDVNIYFGVRGNYYNKINEFKFEPRIVINKKFGKFLNLQITGESKNQIISQIDESILSSLSLERKVWRLSDGDNFPIINNFQITSGILFNKNNWTIDLDLFYKETNGITSLSLGFLNPNDNLFHKGKQKSYGADIYIKKKITNNFHAWITYSYLDSKNKYNGLNNNQYFTSSTEIKNSINTSLHYKKNNLQVAIGWIWRNGKPLTDLDIDENGNYYYDGINTEKLKNYHRLDLSATYGFYLSKKRKSKGKVGISIRNLYNNKNHINTSFSGNNTINDPIEIFEYHSIGITPNFMLRFYL